MTPWCSQLGPFKGLAVGGISEQPGFRRENEKIYNRQNANVASEDDSFFLQCSSFAVQHSFEH